MQALLEAGADVNASDMEQLTAIMGAAARGQADCVRLLLAAGASLTAPIDVRLFRAARVSRTSYT